MSDNNKPRGIDHNGIMNKVARVTFAPDEGRGADNDPLSGEPTKDLTESQRPEATKDVHAGRHVRIEHNGRVMTKQVQNRVPSTGVLYFTDGTSYIPTDPQYESVEVVDKKKKREMQEAAEQVRMEKALKERHNKWGGEKYDTYLDKLAAILYDFLSGNGRNNVDEILDMLEAGPSNNIPEMEHHEFAPKEDIEALRGKWQEVASRVRKMVRRTESDEPDEREQVTEAFQKVNEGRPEALKSLKEGDKDKEGYEGKEDDEEESVNEAYELAYEDGEYLVGGQEPWENWVRRLRDAVKGSRDTAKVLRVLPEKGNTQATIRLNHVTWPAPLDLHIRPVMVDDQTRKDIMEFTITAPKHGDTEMASTEKGMEGGRQKALPTAFLTRPGDGMIDQAVDRLMSMESNNPSSRQSGSDISERIRRHLDGENLEETHGYDPGPPSDDPEHINPYAGTDKDPAPGRDTPYRAQPFVDNLQFNASVARKVSEAFRGVDDELAEGLEQFSTRCLEVADEIKRGKLSKDEAEQWSSYATSISEMALDRYDEEVGGGYAGEMTRQPGGDFYDAKQDDGDYETNPDNFTPHGDSVERGDYSPDAKKNGHSGRKTTRTVKSPTT